MQATQGTVAEKPGIVTILAKGFLRNSTVFGG
jgi:hypothetical protein